MRIARRAESTDRSTLATTYVAAGSFAAVLNSTDHQILYGRRGTGKTHALLYLSDLIDSAGDVFVYVDLRTIGSAGGLYADSALNSTVRGTHLLVDTLEVIHEELLTIAVERGVADQDGLLRALDLLVDAATAVKVVGQVECETTLAGATETTDGLQLNLSARPAAEAATTRKRSLSAGVRLRRTGVEPATRCRRVRDRDLPWLRLPGTRPGCRGNTQGRHQHRRAGGAARERPGDRHRRRTPCGPGLVPAGQADRDQCQRTGTPDASGVGGRGGGAPQVPHVRRRAVERFASRGHRHALR
ncbi:MAG TPA: hypothetical protein VGD84_04355, partial [Pseudonocardiaceae bacterium]